MLVGKPPFQTKDVKAIYKKIKSLEYSFPSSVAISDEAVDLIEAILDREPQNRPAADEILSHPFQYAGPFPKSIPDTAVQTEPDYSTISSSQSARNYLYVQKLSGASLLPPTSSSEAAPMASSSEEREQTPPEPPAQVVALSNGTNVVAQELALEKEVKKVLEPGSPISELLKSARKPLMVSPRAQAAQREREKNEIARRAVQNSSNNSARMYATLKQEDKDGEKENRRPAAAHSTRSTGQQQQGKKEHLQDGETGLENAVRALRVTNGAGANSVKDSTATANAPAGTGTKRKLAASASSSIVVAREEEKLVHSHRDAYEACYKTLEATISGPSPTIQLEGGSRV